MQSWATKYRPRTFEDVRGQQEKVHLRAMLKQGGEFPPLLILRGPSGTGKTTIARIIAAALNCERLGAKGDPCTECDPCLAIASGDYAGVSEHNAAFRNGAEDMRELQERAYLQTEGKYTVFLLDEAQALSGQAWKVLLKVFEEPPAGCVFVLITSEPSKIPRTIQTRALSYDFGKVAADQVRIAVDNVLTAESATVEGIDLIVDLADGSVREAIMLAEQCWRSGGSAHEVFGGRDTTLEIVEAAAENDMAKGLRAVEAMWQSVGDPIYIVEKLGLQFQRVLYEHYDLPLHVSPEAHTRLRIVASNLGDRKLTTVMEVIAEWYPRVRTKAHLLFLWTDLLRKLHHGPSPVKAATAVKPKAPVVALSGDEAKNALEGIKFG